MISVIIPSYKRKESLALLLDDLAQQEFDSYEVIVVDDRSPDDTVEFTRNNYPWVVSLVNETNSGPAASRNHGIQFAKGEIVVGIDSDVRVDDHGFLKKIESEFQKDSSLTGIAVRVFEGDGETDDAPRWWHPVPIERFKNSRFSTNYFSGTSFAFRTRELNEAGRFPADLFQFYEEVELSYKILDNGGEIIYDPRIYVLHFPGPRPGRDRKRFYFNLRNQILLCVKCMPIGYSIRFLIPRLGYYFLKTLLTGNISTYFKALKDALSMAKTRKKTRKVLNPDVMRKMKAMKNQEPLTH